MREIAADTETHPIKPGGLTPAMVCLSFAERTALDGILQGLVDRPEGLVLVRDWLLDDEVILVGHNIWYDLGVACAEEPSLLPLVFNKLDKGLVRDTQVQQQMLDIASGEMKFHVDEETGEPKKTSYSLAALSYRLLKKFVHKKDTWRLKYALLDGVPIAEWPKEAVDYAVGDAVTTLEVHEAQQIIAGVPVEIPEIPDAKEQFKAAWALHLMCVWGVRTDGEAVAKLKNELQTDLERMMTDLRKTDLIKQVKKKGIISDVKDMKSIRARVERAFASRGEECPHTDASKKFPNGQVGTDKKTMKDSGDEQLVALSEAGSIGKLLTTYIPALEQGTKVPVNARFNVLVETGRTSCARPNWQNPPRKGGVRECIVAR